MRWSVKGFKLAKSSCRRFLYGLAASIFSAFATTGAYAQLQADLNKVGQFHAPAIEHCPQSELLAVTDPNERFNDAFECGDNLFSTRFNALDGVGANVGDHQRFTRVPRADKTGPTEWANHFPPRATGPNAEACDICHNDPVGDGAGPAGVNVIRDPQHSADPGRFINRNTPHLFAPGGLQLLAEEMSTDLRAIRASAIAQATGGGVNCSIVSSNTWPSNYQVDVRVVNNGNTTTNGWTVTLNFNQPANIYNSWNVAISNGNSTTVTGRNVSYNANLSPGGSIQFGVQGTRGSGTFTPPTCVGSGGSGGHSVTLPLTTKGVSFGTITANPDGTVITSGIRGVDTDLVIKPFEWKGNFFTVRSFNRDASNNELGMQPVELTGDNFDGDGDNVVNEMLIGDESALAVYMAAQPRPVTTIELNNLGLLDTPLTSDQIAAIQRGSSTFQQIGCATCHRPSLTVNDPVFREPSPRATYRDAVFPAGQDPVSRGVDPNNPIMFNITTDQPENIVMVNGQEVHLGSFESNGQGGAIVRLYGDLKRHDMGPGLAENIDETGSGASVWITKELWGVGSTAPYLHDARATTLTEAILIHGGEAQASRDAANALSESSFNDLLAFLNSLVLFRTSED